ncbi:hypothetical protein [Candidatus Contubernalis alkaliaceticus]|uniref:hypothetical protein n=1 Tax=Candidatus Contubernalis alkaliaceticus TaxID=338645 RepID=UPI001F4BD0BE|nr:hypothetical protein [Candidatus Contubernalis alkalaceticus]UNC93503.1 hypothetical protein HUE98_16315 [Candidatus Contubernalis alkalaceticus]
MLKDEIKQIIDNLPDDCSIEDIQYTLYVKSKILKGLEDIKNGNSITNEEMEKKFDKWLKQ